ncbi:MAG: EamA family transporter [Candidatus Neomarinimicrobiota bacterium]|nr:EamA family transporter [Candidatus Neomarinimicrobiota bacterium]
MSRGRAILMLVMTGIMWSLGGLLIKIIPWHPLAISGIRGGIAALTIFLLTRNLNFTWSRKQIAAAVCYVLVVTLFVIANKLTTAGNSILLQYTAPVYVALFGYAFLGERSTRIDWITILVLLTGLILFFFDELTTSGVLGNVCAILSGMSFAALTILLRKQKDEDPSNSVLLGNLLTLLVGLPAIVTGVTLEPLPWLLIVILGVFQLGIPYVLYTTAIKYVSALDAIIYPIIEPILNPVLVFLILGETLGTWAIFGGLLVIGGVIVRGVLQKEIKNKKALG